MEKTVSYGGGLVSVSYEVAEFLESDRKRQAAEERRDRRHHAHTWASKSSFETVLAAQKTVNPHQLEDEVFKNLTLENLRKVIAALNTDEQRLLHLYFWQEMSMEQIGKLFGVSKMAISKRLKKLLAKMRSLMET
jgi:RNA polymerase sigma factor (sigma-70 family)